MNCYCTHIVFCFIQVYWRTLEFDIFWYHIINCYPGYLSVVKRVRADNIWTCGGTGCHLSVLSLKLFQDSLCTLCVHFISAQSYLLCRPGWKTSLVYFVAVDSAHCQRPQTPSPAENNQVTHMPQVKCLKRDCICTPVWHYIHHQRKILKNHTCRSCPSVPYTAPSTPWESRQTTQLSTVRCSGRLQKFSMHDLIPYTKNKESGKLWIT